MKFYGHANLQQNELQAATLQTETSFPASPTVGRIAFINKTVYICAEIVDQVPVWIPLTNQIGIYVHVQDTAATNWIITHNLGTPFVLVQTFDGNNQLFIPDTITINNSNQVTVHTGSLVAGRAVIVTGSLDGARPPVFAAEYQQTSPSDTWVINHNLGYNPAVRVFIAGAEVQPLTIVHNSLNTTTITFATAQIGIAKLI